MCKVKLVITARFTNSAVVDAIILDLVRKHRRDEFSIKLVQNDDFVKPSVETEEV